MIVIIVISLFVGFIIGAMRERVLNKNYNRTQVLAYLDDMASYVSKKELRDDFENDFYEWKRKTKFFRDYLLNSPKKQ